MTRHAVGVDFDLTRYAACVFDLDGTVWLGATPIPGAIDVLDRCRAGGTQVAFATNAIVVTPQELSERLVACGLAHPDEPVVTGGTVMTQTVVASGAATVAAVVPPALAGQLDDAGVAVVVPDDPLTRAFGEPCPEFALVMAASRQATIGSLERLGRLAAAGHRVYVSSQDAGFPTDDGIEPGGGVLLAAARTMYDFEPITVGKPSRFYADAIAAALGSVDGPIAVFGDSQRADMGIAGHLGADGILLTGYSLRPIDPDLPRPTYVAATLADVPQPFGASAAFTRGAPA
jgi:HAD superfamily hydrolase (TIGR01450 family)